MRWLAVLLLLAQPLSAQRVIRPQHPVATVGTLPTNESGLPGRVYRVTDGADVNDCSVGGGSTMVLCVDDGTTWQLVTTAATLPGPHSATHSENGVDEVLAENLGTACLVNQLIESDGLGGLICKAVGVLGTANILDLLDDGTDESVDLVEIAVTGDTNSIFTEPAADKLLIDLSKDWPNSDTADALAANGANCTSSSSPLGVDAAGAVEGCFDVLEPTEIDTEAELEALLTDVTNIVTDGDTAGGDLGGTYPDPTVDDDSHNHTTTTLGSIDISDDTNLAVTAPITLTDDTVGITQNAGTDVTADLEEETHASEHVENGADELLAESLGTACAVNELIEGDGTGGLACVAAGTVGTANILDLGDDASNESADLIEIATVNDTNSIFTEPAADKLLIDMSKDWPNADTADALGANGANCTAGFGAGGVDASGAAEDCVDFITGTENAATATALAANGANCSAGNYPLGVDASGAAEGCTADSTAHGPDENVVINSDDDAVGSFEMTDSLGNQILFCDPSVSNFHCNISGALHDLDYDTFISIDGQGTGDSDEITFDVPAGVGLSMTGARTIFNQGMFGQEFQVEDDGGNLMIQTVPEVTGPQPSEVIINSGFADMDFIVRNDFGTDVLKCDGSSTTTAWACAIKGYLEDGDQDTFVYVDYDDADSDTFGVGTPSGDKLIINDTATTINRSGTDHDFVVLDDTSKAAFRVIGSIPGSVEVNPFTQDVDFRVDGDTVADILFCDASADSCSMTGSFTGNVTGSLTDADADTFIQMELTPASDDDYVNIEAPGGLLMLNDTLDLNTGFNIDSTNITPGFGPDWRTFTTICAGTYCGLEVERRKTTSGFPATDSTVRIGRTESGYSAGDAKVVKIGTATAEGIEVGSVVTINPAATADVDLQMNLDTEVGILCDSGEEECTFTEELTGSEGVTTTDATLTTVETLTIANGKAWFFEVTYIAKGFLVAEHASYIRRGVITREGGGAVIEGPIQTIFSRESSGGFDGTFSVSGSDVLVQVQGKAATTLNWEVRYKILEIP